MSLWQRFLRWRLARAHGHLSRAFTLRHARTKRLETYVVCLDCGAELEYDLRAMRLTGRLMKRPVQSPDLIAIERAWQDGGRGGTRGGGRMTPEPLAVHKPGQPAATRYFPSADIGPDGLVTAQCTACGWSCGPVRNLLDVARIADAALDHSQRFCLLNRRN